MPQKNVRSPGEIAWRINIKDNVERSARERGDGFRTLNLGGQYLFRFDPFLPPFETLDGPAA